MNIKYKKISLVLLLAVGVLFPVYQSEAATTVTADITSDKTWDTNGSPYLISNSISIASGAKLTINPGVVVQFATGTQMTVDGSIVTGNKYDFLNKKVYFTSQGDNISTLWWEDLFKKNRNTSTANTGDYIGLVFNPGSSAVLKNAEIRFADTAITATDAHLTLSDVDFIKNNNPLVLDYATTFIPNDLTYSNNTNNTISISGDVTESYTFKQSAIPYTLQSSLTITSGTILTLERGVDLIGSGTTINVDGGVINAFDTRAGIIFDNVNIQAFNGADLNFTGVTIKNLNASAIEIHDDSTLDADQLAIIDVSGDGIIAFNNTTLTIKNSSITNVGSSRSGITLFASSTANIQRTSISKGGNGIVAFNQATLNADRLTIKNASDGAIISFGSDPFSDNNIRVQNSEFTANGFAFYPVSKTTISATNNSIYGNDIGVLLNPGTTYDFSKNWWGDRTGPFNAASNPTGTGDEVSDSVIFRPFLTRDPLTNRQYRGGKGRCDDDQRKEYRRKVEDLVEKLREYKHYR